MEGDGVNCPNCGDPLPPQRGPGQQRKWCSDYCRKQQYATGNCIACGKRLPYHGRAAPSEGRRCADCEQSRNVERNRQIVAAWNEGQPEWYIAEQQGLTPGQVRGCVQQVRKRGEHVELHRQRNRTDWAEIERLFHAGRTYREIAGATGDTPEGVAEKIKNMRKAGFDLPARSRSRRYYAEDVAELEAMWERGDSHKQIATRLGITATGSACLISRLRAEGYDFPRRPGGRP